MGMSGQRLSPAALYFWQRTTGTHWIGGWVGLRAVWTQALELKYLSSARNRTPVVQSVVRHYTNWATPTRTTGYNGKVLPDHTTPISPVVSSENMCCAISPFSSAPAIRSHCPVFSATMRYWSELPVCSFSIRVNWHLEYQLASK
jgi:hypothetical protein